MPTVNALLLLLILVVIIIRSTPPSRLFQVDLITLEGV